MLARISTIKLLLEHGTSIRYGQLLHFAMIRRSGVQLETIELLLHLGCPIDSIFFQDDSRSWLESSLTGKGTALFSAAERGYHEVVAYLLSRGADAAKLSSKGRSALEVAESKGYSKIVRLLSQ
jgi:ankyrin repeat protein